MLVLPKQSCKVSETGELRTDKTSLFKTDMERRLCQPDSTLDHSESVSCWFKFDKNLSDFGGGWIPPNGLSVFLFCSLILCLINPFLQKKRKQKKNTVRYPHAACLWPAQAGFFLCLHIFNRIDKIVLNIDLAPTFLRLAGARVPRAMDGMPITRLLKMLRRPG